MPHRECSARICADGLTGRRPGARTFLAGMPAAAVRACHAISTRGASRRLNSGLPGWAGMQFIDGCSHITGGNQRACALIAPQHPLHPALSYRSAAAADHAIKLRRCPAVHKIRLVARHGDMDPAVPFADHHLADYLPGADFDGFLRSSRLRLPYRFNPADHVAGNERLIAGYPGHHPSSVGVSPRVVNIPSPKRHSRTLANSHKRFGRTCRTGSDSSFSGASSTRFRASFAQNKERTKSRSVSIKSL